MSGELDYDDLRARFDRISADRATMKPGEYPEEQPMPDAASPSPSEMDVVAWLDETADAAPGAKGVTTDAYTAAYWEHTSGAPMTELVRASNAQSVLVAKDAEAKKWWLKCCETQQDLNAAIARIKALEEAQEPALEHIEGLLELLKVIKNHWIDYDHVFSIAVHEAEDFLARSTLKENAL